MRSRPSSRPVRHADHDLEVHTVEPGSVDPGELAAMASPSLFGGTRVIVVRRAHELGAELAAELVALIAESGDLDDVHLVVTHSGAANRGKAVLEAARKAGAHEVSAAPLKKFTDRQAFLAGEFRHGRRSIDEAATRALLESVGDDVRELASAASQLMSDTEGVIDLAAVRRYYAGRADVTSFAVADRTVEGRTGEAVELLRHALASGVAPVLVTSALATQLRSLVLVASAPRGLSQGDVARHAGLPPWKVDVVRRQLQGLGRRRHRASHPGRRARRRGGQGGRRRPGLRPGEGRGHRLHLAHRPDLARRERRNGADPGGDDAVAGCWWVRRRARQPAWPSRTSCSRPGCCG